MFTNRVIEEEQSVKKIDALFRRILNEERGQAVLWAAIGLSLFLAAGGGLTVDLSRAYVVKNQLQNAVNAAALAAANQAYFVNSGSDSGASTTATQYSAASSDENANNVGSNVGAVASTPTVTLKCVNALMPSGSSCTTGMANAVQVTQTATLQTYFMRILGYPSLAVSATATASMEGPAQPWNIAIILDGTGSMSTSDSNCKSGSTTPSEFQCAANALELMLGRLNPCPAGASSCSSPYIHVALFSFPGVTSSSVGDDICSSNGTPNFTAYILPSATATTFSPTIKYTSSTLGSWTGTYEITEGASDADTNGFVSDYYSSTASNHLYSSSSINKALGGCLQVIQSLGSGAGGNYPYYPQNATGIGVTYYASVIYSAQQALAAEQTTYPKAKNAIIFLSDGQANMYDGNGDGIEYVAGSGYVTQRCTSRGQNVSCSTDSSDGNDGAFPTSFTSTVGLSTLTRNGTYPDSLDECQQAMVAGQYATSQGTRVYGVAYGSEASGCGTNPTGGGGYTDTTLVATGNNVAFTSASAITPCVTIENIASSLTYFYSDYNQSGSGIDTSCQSTINSAVSLNDIGISIGGSLSGPALIPNNLN
jgi:Flp pilus assembly protein TadG